MWDNRSANDSSLARKAARLQEERETDATAVPAGGKPKATSKEAGKAGERKKMKMMMMKLVLLQFFCLLYKHLTPLYTTPLKNNN